MYLHLDDLPFDYIKNSLENPTYETLDASHIISFPKPSSFTLPKVFTCMATYV